ncbi:3'-5' exonuclease [Chromobacterium phragmitis]
MSRTQAIMVDMETLSTGVRPIILSIGAVMFDPEAWSTPEEILAAGGFWHANILIEEQIRAGRTADSDTFKWWMSQGREAVEALFTPPPVLLQTAVSQFVSWVGAPHTWKDIEFWSYGAATDIVWLNGALNDSSFPDVPYRNVNCLRTLAKITGVKCPEFGDKHNALHDAVAQAMWVQRCNEALRGMKQSWEAPR